MSAERVFLNVARIVGSQRVADPRLSDGGAPIPRGGANLLFSQPFPKKLHENERNWTERGVTHPLPPPDRPMSYV